MDKIKIRTLPMVYPIPAVLAGAIVEGKPNYVTLGNCGIISVDPPVIYISSHKSHYTNKGIHDNNVFSVNIPSSNLMNKLDYCGLVSGCEVDKSKIFETFYGNSSKIPLINDCPINMECEVINIIDVYDMEVFIGRVTEVYADKECLIDGFPDTQKVNPLFYSIDNSYWNIGKQIGEGFSEGKKIR